MTSWLIYFFLIYLLLNAWSKKKEEKDSYGQELISYFERINISYGAIILF